MPFRASILTLYPDMFPGPLGVSLAGKALQDGIWSLEARNIRDSATDKHRSVDDTPAGGGAGMVLRPDVLASALDRVADGRPMLALTPRGAPLTQARVRDLATGEGVILLCGRYEGDPDCQHRSTVWPLQQDRIVDAHLKALDEAKVTGRYQKSQQFYIHGPVGFSR